MGKKLKISHKNFDAMLDRIVHNGYPINKWFPSIEEAKEIVQNPKGNYEFMLWIVESNPDIELSDEQMEAERYIQKALQDYTEFI